jgi:translation elongation factor EF-1alpha
MQHDCKWRWFVNHAGRYISCKMRQLFAAVRCVAVTQNHAGKGACVLASTRLHTSILWRSQHTSGNDAVRARCCAALQTALIEVTPVRPMPLEKFADVKALGRIALREAGRTVAVGVVTGINE